ncbi:MAG: hypothetical protein D4R48_00540 [Nitrosomonadales bacterium]|nr:MAG: hypothetical protein D4R48_00540 [Nitrosomonadales bacterium]
MSTELEQQLSDFSHWREQIASAIADYRSWLDLAGGADSVQDLRLYDMLESLKHDRLVLAFVAEFARGKSETINALFFSDYKTRLLPCDAGRTTMCPTEIFWDQNEEPCIKLLPIETRKRDDGLMVLKTTPKAWTRLRLDTSSTEAMQEAMQALVQQKEVTLEEARDLGLWDDADITMQHALKTKGKVDIPTWRHAQINFPHPLLKSGLVILDTPGLNTLGTEPELTINIIPNAHAVIFMLATDTGVTKSDMTIWTDYLRGRTSRKLAVLNKIDMLWDDLKTEQEIQAMIQSQVDTTARQLGLPASDVFAISAQKALLARVRDDHALLQRSGIERLEHALAQGIVAAKHEILCNTVLNEASDMVKVSRKASQQRLAGARAQLQEFDSLRGKSRDVVESLLSKAAAERKRYEASILNFNQSQQRVTKMGQVLMQQLSMENLDVLLDKSRQKIGDAWTTHGLNQGMKALIAETSALAERITRQGLEIKNLSEQLYHLFHTRHGFAACKPPVLDMSVYQQSMLALQRTTEEFCANPINVMTEKHFLVRKFFYSLVGQARSMFEQAHAEASLWLKDILTPLKQQINEQKAQLDKRTESLMKVHENMESLQQNIRDVEEQVAALQRQNTALDQILLTLVKAAQQAAPPQAATEAETAGGPTLDMTPLTA